nr:MAG TPA: Dna polymerase B [Caudoviricetes sp.]
MAIIRSERRKNFTHIDNKVFADNVLSFRAMGLLGYLLSKPDNWSVSARHLATVTEQTARPAAINAVHETLKELRQAGFIVMKKRHTGETDYFVFDEPQNADVEVPNQEKPNQAKPNQIEPDVENPNQEKPNQEKPDVLINTESKQELNNNNTSLSPNGADADALVAADATTEGGDSESLADIADQPSNSASLAESANDAAAHSGSPKRKAIAPVPVQQVLQTYNEVLGDKLPKAQLLNDKRKRVIAGRWKEMLNSKDPSGKVRFTDTVSGLAWFAKFFAKVALNPHWLGENDRGWRADLDWILKPDNFLRILEWRPK